MKRNTNQKTPPLYRNPACPIAERVADLLQRMTLEEKALQMQCVIPYNSANEIADGFFFEKGRFCRRMARERLARGIGHICYPMRNFPPAAAARLGNAIQKFLVEETRLGIPALLHEEALHGCCSRGATSFPQAIGLAAAWDVALMTRVAAAIGAETRAYGYNQCLAPTINIARDPRCGRTEETYGEDPHLTARLAVAYVKAVQARGVACTAKHFAANFVGDGGRDSHEVHCSERILRELYFPAFEACVREAGVLSVMPAYNAVDGTPCTSHAWLLEDVLRREWGFDGVIVSDYGAVRMLHTLHQVAETEDEAARLAIEAGTDIELPYPRCYRAIPDLVRDGRLPVAKVDAAVGRILSLKFKLGLFENPYSEPRAAEQVVGRRAHKALALTAARKSMVLLKNQDALLPLENVCSIAVIGPNAAEGRLGNYSTHSLQPVSPLDGVRRLAGSRIRVGYAKGCELNDACCDGFGDACALAAASDVAVLFMGNTSLGTEGEQMDRCRIELPGVQEDLIRAVAETGTPVVVVLINGSAVAMERWIDRVSAVLEAWYAGESGGLAMAETLFGRNNPAGRLPLTFPRTTGQLPLYYNPKKSGRVYDYVDQRGEQPMFPFGHGLSYTTFRYSRLKVTPKTGTQAQAFRVSVEVCNTGGRAGDEVVQLYLTDCYASVSRPVRELKGFRRIALKPGQKKTVEFTLTPQDLRMLDSHLRPAIEPGEFEIQVGGSSASALKTRLTVR